MYRIGRGEEGVFGTPPYSKAIGAVWRFRTPALARSSAAAILAMYRGYRAAGDFAGMDMCRKFLQMGYTRSRRYARHAGGRKHGPDGRELPLRHDAVKEASARVFAAAWRHVREDPEYQRRKALHLRESRRRAQRVPVRPKGPS